MEREPEDRLFERWCRRGDPEALGELFDATAPRLLKLAIHLVGDSCEAEDLVQATFLAALEQRTSVDPSRPVMPWLTSVLGHKAQQHRRRAGRALDVARLEQRAVEDPSRPLETRELDGEVARALDGLDEPYRAVLVLRLRHGMELADIAHVLERDPGTVRVQLHRGLEKLRATLPERLVSALFCLPLAPRGLDLVREVVVQRAATVAAGGGGALVVGGLVGKKVLVAAGVGLALVALWWLQRSQSENERVLELARQAELALPRTQLAPAARPEQSVARASSTPSAAREPAAPGTAVLRGRVVDAETQEPLVGAELRFFAPRRGTALELVRAQPELFELDAHGELKTTTQADWPLVVVPSALARFGRDPVTAFSRPRADEEPLASARSASDGSFALAAGIEGVLEGACAGHATRWRAVRTPADELVLELWRERELRGVVLGPDGAPVGEGVELVLVGIQTPRNELEGNDDDTDAPSAPRAWGPADIAGLGAWPVRTDANGRFVARVGASSVTARLVSPGWDAGPIQYVDPEESELVVHALRVPSLHFFDATSGAPIERVRLLGRDQGFRSVYVSGEFAAPGGFLEVPGGAFLLHYHAVGLALVAWSEGHAPARLTLADLGRSETIEVPFAAGDLDALEGVVLREGAPLAGVEVALLGFDPSWRLQEEYVLDATRTDPAGHFHLEATSGAFLVRVRASNEALAERVAIPGGQGATTEIRLAGREPFFERVELPRAEPLTLELARVGRIEVELVDGSDAALPGRLVSLLGPDDRHVTALSDSEGHAPFANLPAGHYRVYASPLRGSGNEPEKHALELVAGGVERVRIELVAPTGPRHARVVARDADDYTGWRARFADQGWSELTLDGVVPQDLNEGNRWLEILAPYGRHWHLEVPKDAADGHVFELVAGDGRYRGVLEHDDGSPWPGVAVHAVPWSSPRPLPRVSTVTDAAGAFELPSLASTEYRLLFNTQVERSPWDEVSNALFGVVFQPLALPSPDGERFEVRVAEVASVRVRGKLERAGRPLADAQLSFECAQPVAYGTLYLCGSFSGRTRTFTRSDERGEFELELPHTPRVTVRVVPSFEEGVKLTRELGPLADGAELRLVVP